MLGILPKEKLGVIVLSNTNTSAPVVYDIASKALQISLETKTGYKNQQKIKSPKRQIQICRLTPEFIKMVLL